MLKFFIVMVSIPCFLNRQAKVLLKLVDASEQEVSEIKQFCEGQFSQVRYELNDWDWGLVNTVTHLEVGEISNEELLSLVLERIPSSFDDKKPGKQWLGKVIKRLGVIMKKTGGNHPRTIYIVDRE